MSGLEEVKICADAIAKQPSREKFDIFSEVATRILKVKPECIVLPNGDVQYWWVLPGETIQMTYSKKH